MRGSLFTARARWLDRAALARRIRIAATLAVALQLVFATSAAAYTRSTATAYAESWWSTYNTFWVRYDNDCANFVSQAIFAGGVPMNYSQANPWYAEYGAGHAYSQSWRLVSYNRGFFLNDTHPGGYIVNAYYGKPTAATSGVAGDIVYYGWRGDRYFDTDPHESIIVVTNGWATSYSDYGALVDAHTTARHKEYWTLYRFNARWPSTYIEVLHFRA